MRVFFIVIILHLILCTIVPFILGLGFFIKASEFYMIVLYVLIFPVGIGKLFGIEINDTVGFILTIFSSFFWGCVLSIIFNLINKKN